MYDQKWFRAGLWVLLAFAIIWVGSQIEFIFRPLVVIVQTLFVPLLAAGVLFFLLRPPVQFLVSRKVPRALAILLLYLLIAGFATIAALTVGPLVRGQFAQLIEALPGFIELAIAKTYELLRSEAFASFLATSNIDPDALAEQASGYVMTVVDVVSRNLSNIVGFIANVFMIVLVVPFILFYFLKDGEKMFEGLIGLLPKRRQSEGRELLLELDRTIGLFIQGQMTVAVSVGVMLLIGFEIIGLNYAVLLAFFAMITNVIPYLGAFLAAAPALIVGLADSPQMALKVLLVTVIAQQIEGNLLSPWIMGKGLNIHPLTIILLLLVVGTLIGPVGLLFAIPGYAVLKIVAVYAMRWMRKGPEDPIDA
ncbi:AI-2E family transporter [Paenibacillus sp.]|uniref:AI-2E family transporter n=1 Tax=Paenibacillus sp. TaxID=58172 RepID=UPI002D25C4EF|nr:AI-2E family transporter [Paenibacillus sp.]HZG85568.1 AI-2E family transporter [Paenibacillus sp.]